MNPMFPSSNPLPREAEQDCFGIGKNSGLVYASGLCCSIAVGACAVVFVMAAVPCCLCCCLSARRVLMYSLDVLSSFLVGFAQFCFSIANLTKTVATSFVVLCCF